LIFLPVLEIGFEHFEQICSKTAGWALASKQKE
jgi:hypothetical protein